MTKGGSGHVSTIEVLVTRTVVFYSRSIRFATLVAVQPVVSVSLVVFTVSENRGGGKMVTAPGSLKSNKVAWKRKAVRCVTNEILKQTGERGSWKEKELGHGSPGKWKENIESRELRKRGEV